MAYILKEELHDLWNYHARKEALVYWMNWIYKAWSSGIKMVMKCANTIAGYRVGILNDIDHPTTIGNGCRNESYHQDFEASGLWF